MSTLLVVLVVAGDPDAADATAFDDEGNSSDDTASARSTSATSTVDATRADPTAAVADTKKVLLSEIDGSSNDNEEGDADSSSSSERLLHVGLVARKQVRAGDDPSVEGCCSEKAHAHDACSAAVAATTENSAAGRRHARGCTIVFGHER